MVIVRTLQTRLYFVTSAARLTGQTNFSSLLYIYLALSSLES